MAHASSSGGTALTSAKERHYAYLASRIAALSNTLEHTQHYMAIASEQAAYMKDLGIGQASLYVPLLTQVHGRTRPGRSGK